MRKIRVPFFFFILILIPTLTYLTIKLASGYSFNFSQKQFEPRGILVATSIPDGGQVFVDGELKSATDTTISLKPGHYRVEIKKEGFSSWQKELLIEKELVTKTDAFLFKIADPEEDLRPITFFGAENPILSPDSDKIVYASNATESGKAGFWLLDLNEFPFGISRSPKQILQSKIKGRNFAWSEITWSPDARQILVNSGTQNFLLDPSQLILEENLIDVTSKVKALKQSWKEEETRINDARLKRLPIPFRKITATAAANLQFSPDGEKLLYQATASAIIPEKLSLPLPASSTQKETRKIKSGALYVYDLKEDKNFFIAEVSLSPLSIFPFSPTLSWFPTSRHLLWREEKEVNLIEYDGTNKTTIFQGKINPNGVFSAPAANKIFLLFNPEQESSATNLYLLNLK